MFRNKDMICYGMLFIFPLTDFHVAAMYLNVILSSRIIFMIKKKIVRLSSHVELWHTRWTTFTAKYLF